MNPLLQVEDLSVSYGHIAALHNIRFEVGEGELVALLGANGAGKSSTLRALSGLVPWRGRIRLGGRNLARVPADRIVAMGMVQVPEGRGIFGNLTVLENLKLATWRRRDREALAADYERVFALFPRLAERKGQRGGLLSGGEQQMLAVGRALMSRGRLLLLDEPSMGLSPLLVKEIFRVLVDINRQGTTILLVEQNARMALSIASRGYVLENGRIALSNTGAELASDSRLEATYLGE